MVSFCPVHSQKIRCSIVSKHATERKSLFNVLITTFPGHHPLRRQDHTLRYDAPAHQPRSKIVQDLPNDLLKKKHAKRQILMNHESNLDLHLVRRQKCFVQQDSMACWYSFRISSGTEQCLSQGCVTKLLQLST